MRHYGSSAGSTVLGSLLKKTFLPKKITNYGNLIKVTIPLPPRNLLGHVRCFSQNGQHHHQRKRLQDFFVQNRTNKSSN